MMCRHILIVLSWFALLSLAACAPSSATPPPATYQAIPLKGDPRLTFSTTNDALLIDITSPTGIGSATIEKTAGEWPGKIVMRLRVKGLENFKFRYAETGIELSVSSRDNQAVYEAYEQAGQQGVVKAGDPYWIAVTPGEGYFDLEAPIDFLKSGENKFTIEWIDFYR
jgi:hypothetical protein